MENDLSELDADPERYRKRFARWLRAKRIAEQIEHVPADARPRIEGRFRLELMGMLDRSDDDIDLLTIY